MFGSEMLDIFIGLATVYFFMSLVTSSVMEAINQLFALRSSNLKEGITHLLRDGELNTDDLYSHPLIEDLYKQGWWDRFWDRLLGSLYHRTAKPSYIHPRTFALALMDKLNVRPTLHLNDATRAKLMQIVKRLPDYRQDSIFRLLDSPDSSRVMQGLTQLRQAASELLKEDPDWNEIRLWLDTISLQDMEASIVEVLGENHSLVSLMRDARGDIEKFQANVERWFDEAMERVGGWYKRKIRLVTFLIGFAAAFGFNVDSVMTANILSEDEAMRTAVATVATENLDELGALVPETDGETTSDPEAEGDTGTSATGTTESDPFEAIENFERGLEEQGVLRLPYEFAWWSDSDIRPDDLYGWMQKIVGMLATGFLVTLGAPFWFDILSKVVNLRTTGKQLETGQQAATAESTDKRSS